MNIALTKTMAEQAVPELLDRVGSRLPGGEKAIAGRKQALGRFQSLGLPHRRIEEWKYTDLRNSMKEVLPPRLEDASGFTSEALSKALGPFSPIESDRIVFVDGVYSAQLSSSFESGGDVSVAPLSEALASGLASLEADGADAGQNAVLALNAAFVTDGAVISIAESAELDTPLFVVNVRAAKEPSSISVRNMITVGTKARATIVEVFVAAESSASSAQANSATEVTAADEAELTHIKCVIDGGEITHLSNWLAELGKDTTYNGFQFTMGALMARNGINVTYGGTGGKLDMSGAFLARGNEHVDSTLVVDHAVPECESRELFKGVLANRGRGIFQGKVIVRRDAQKTDGKQMAQALMLSPDAEFDSKPELEIYADDVVCGHGSTVAEIDDDLMFYCRSRGIPESVARALLVESFIGEALEKVEHDALREALRTHAMTWLETTEA